MKRTRAAESAPAEKKRTRLPLSAYLSYLLVATVLFTGVTFSGYITAVNGGDSARVAKFEITETMFKNVNGVKTEETMSAPISAALAPGESVTREIIVGNVSEVAIEYGVDLVRVTNNLPALNLNLKLDTVDAEIQELPNNTYRLPAGKTADFTLTIHWPVDPVQYPNNTSPDYVGKADELWVVITATQAD